MITLALNSLAAGRDGQRKGVFANKYLAIHNLETDTLSIEDTTLERGTIYEVQRGKASTINSFTATEQEMFALPLEMNSQSRDMAQCER